MSKGWRAILGSLLVIATWAVVTPAPGAAAAGDPRSTTNALASGWPRAHQISELQLWSLESAVDSNGHVHVVGADENRHSPLYHLTNASGKWLQTEILQAPRRGAVIPIGIAVDSDDSIWILFSRWSRWNECGFGGCTGPRRLVGTYVVNNATGAWSVPLALPDAVNGRDHRFVVRNGRVHLAYSKDLKGTTRIWYATNAGGGWSTTQVGRGWGPFLQLGARGDPWIAYTSAPYAGGVTVAHSVNGGKSFAVTAAPGTQSAVDTAVVDGFDLDGAGRPVAIFDRYETDQGYWTYWVRLGSSGWTVPRRLVNRPTTAFDIGPHNRMHFLFDVWDTSHRDGLYYGSSTRGLATTRRIDRSDRFAYDAPSPPETLTLDDVGRAHVVFTIPYNDLRLGTWYLVGPALD